MITVLLFAQLQEVAGKERLQIAASEMSIVELKEWLKSNFQLIQIDSCMCAINEEYSLATDIVKSGDVVAFIPPVSGG